MPCSTTKQAKELLLSLEKITQDVNSAKGLLFSSAKNNLKYMMMASRLTV